VVPLARLRPPVRASVVEFSALVFAAVAANLIEDVLDLPDLRGVEFVLGTKVGADGWQVAGDLPAGDPVDPLRWDAEHLGDGGQFAWCRRDHLPRIGDPR
jgi:hypothetical protein